MKTHAKKRDYVGDAIKTLGGPTITANLIGVSTPTVHNWRNGGKISDVLYAVMVERLTRKAGNPIDRDPVLATWLLGGGTPEDLGPRVVQLDDMRRRKVAKDNAPAQNRTGTYVSGEGAPDNLTVVEAQVSSEKRAA